jgi:putative thioredoxin
VSSHSYDVSIADFQTKVVEASFHAPVLVDFWAPWCEPCKVLKPMLEKLAEEYAGKFILAKINSDENPELAAEFGVRSIPAVKAVVQGQLVDEFNGALPEAQLRAFIDSLQPSPAEPLREQAAAARAAGELVVARALLSQAVALDGKSDAAYLDLAEICLDLHETDDAAAILQAIAGRAEQPEIKSRVEALQARLALEAAVPDDGVDLAALEARVTADGDNLQGRFELAQALAARRQYRPALDQLLEIIRRERKWNEDAARLQMLTLFNLLAADPAGNALAREYRTALARTLN